MSLTDLFLYGRPLVARCGLLGILLFLFCELRSHKLFLEKV